MVVVGVGDEGRPAADEPGRLAVAEAFGRLHGQAEPAQRLQRVGRHCFPLVIMISWAISTTAAAFGPCPAAHLLERLPGGDPVPGDQGALGLLDQDPGVQGPLELGGQLAALLALHGVGDGQGGQVGEGDQGQLALGRPGRTLAENTATTPMAIWL